VLDAERAYQRALLGQIKVKAAQCRRVSRQRALGPDRRRASFPTVVTAVFAAQDVPELCYVAWSTSMANPDILRHTKIPLAQGSGAIPALGFGTLIPDPLSTRQGSKAALEVGFRHFDCAERYRNERAVGDAPVLRAQL
jgi:hypothetical protein